MLRYIAGKDFLEHTRQIFQENQILPFKKLVKFNIIKFMWQYNCNSLPPCFNNEWPQNSDVQNAYNLRNSTSLNIPFSKKQHLSKFTYFLFPKIWEEKGRHISGGQMDPHIFLPSLKKSLLYEYISEKNCDIANCYACKITRERKEQRMKSRLMVIGGQHISQPIT